MAVMREAGDDVQKSFGLRRAVDEVAGRRIMLAMRELQAEGDIPESVRLSRRLYVNLLPHQFIGKQMVRGLLAGYNLAHLGQQLQAPHDIFPEADMVRVDTPKSQHIAIRLHSPELDQERMEIADAIAPLGLRGIYKLIRENDLRIIVGHTNDKFSPTEQRHIQQTAEEAVEEAYGFEVPLAFTELQAYPHSR
jgi:hypothetical protein